MLLADGNKAMVATVCLCIYTTSDALVITKQERSTPFKHTARNKIYLMV